MAHPNWQELLLGSPYNFLSYNDFLGLDEIQKLPAPPFPNIQKNLQKFFLSSPDSCIGLADIESPERFARGERFTETVCRMVGVEDLSKIRPFVPILKSDWSLAEAFLTQNSLSPNSYILLALEASSVEREWGFENFLFVAEKIFECFGLKSVLVHERELPEGLSSSSIISSRGLPLRVICGLIAMSKYFIGNDSGPSHIAAAFDIPVLSIYLEPEKIPFEIRPLSPLATQILLFDSPEKNDIETVLYSAIALINSNRFRQKPKCFACGRPMRHILKANKKNILWKCFCGALWKSEVDEKNIKVDLTPEDDEVTLDRNCISLPSCRSEITLFKKIIGYYCANKLPINVISKNSFTLADSTSFLDQNEKDIVWTVDSILYFFKKQGYVLSNLDCLKKDGFLSFSFSIQEQNKWIVIPWGRKSLQVFGSSLYFKYFAWGSWASSKKLIDLMKSDWEPEQWKDSFWVGLSIFLYTPNIKSFLRWQKLFLKLLFNFKIKRIFYKSMR
ncbi:MAG: glycosyltransferase family 9 protein [Leptospirillum sp.]